MIRRYIFDRWGNWIGNLEDDRYCDPHGRCLGKVTPDGSIYDQKGVYRGHFDVQGQLWDEHGTSLGGVIPSSTSRKQSRRFAPVVNSGSGNVASAQYGPTRASPRQAPEENWRTACRRVDVSDDMPARRRVS